MILTQATEWQETMFNTSNIKITVDMAVTDSGATGNFVLPGTNVSDRNISEKPLTISLPDDTQLKSTHTCEIDVPWIPKESIRAHIVPGVAHTSLLWIKVLTDAVCKVVHAKHECRVYFKNEIVWAGVRNLQRFYGYYLSVKTVKLQSKMEMTMK